MVLIDNFEFLSGWLLNWRGNFWPTRTQIHPLIENTKEEEEEEEFKAEKDKTQKKKDIKLKRRYCR
jgi:hypothetical protein